METKASFTKYSPATEGAKICVGCHEEKHVTEFPKNARNKDGRNTRCKACAAAKVREWRSRNPEAARASETKWRKKNADRVRERNTEWSRTWRAENRERDRTAAKKWKLSNPDRVKEASRRNRVENAARYAAHAAKRRAAILRATPPWLTKEHLDEIAAFYEEARRLTDETGVPYHVDHIAPLRGRKASGLHVPWNLQVITAEENQRKWINEAA